MAVKMDSADDAQNQNTSQEISSQVVATETGQCPMKNHHSRTLKNEALTTKLYGELRGVRVCIDNVRYRQLIVCCVVGVLRHRFALRFVLLSVVSGAHYFYLSPTSLLGHFSLAKGLMQRRPMVVADSM